jgi:hypothetical protein
MYLRSCVVGEDGRRLPLGLVSAYLWLTQCSCSKCARVAVQTHPSGRWTVVCQGE